MDKVEKHVIVYNVVSRDMWGDYIVNDLFPQQFHKVKRMLMEGQEIVSIARRKILPKNARIDFKI